MNINERIELAKLRKITVSKTMHERMQDSAAKYDEQCNLGADHGLRVSIVWSDCERVVHSWEAVAALMGKKASTLRSYQSRGQLKHTLTKHPDFPHALTECEITVIQEGRRGPPVDPIKKASSLEAKEAKRRQKLDTKRLELQTDITKLEASLHLKKTLLEQLNDQV